MSATYPLAPPWGTRRAKVRGIIWSSDETEADAGDEPRRRGGRRRGRGRDGHHHGPHGPHFGGPGSGRRRASRGDVRNAVIALLAEEPQHGYALLGLLAERSGGLWRPSPGSVYPLLGHLENEGLVSSEESDGRRTFSLTDAGRTYVAEHADELREPWNAYGSSRRRGAMSLADGVRSLGSAAREVAHTGTDAQVTRARGVLDDARKALYRILAEDDADGTPQP